MTSIKCRLSSSLFFSDSRLLFFFKFNGFLNIAGVLEKLDSVCASMYRVGRHGKKTDDLLDLF